MRIVEVTDRLTVATQPQLDEFADMAARGYKTVLNNRPESEEPGQPSSAEEAQAAAGAHLTYQHIPVTGPTLTADDVRSFQKAVADSDGPVLAHCKSGTRSLTLYAIGEVLDGRMKAGEVSGFGSKLGFDLRGAEAWLARHGSA